MCSFFELAFWVVLRADDGQGVVPSLRTVHSSMGTTMGLFTLTDQTQTSWAAPWAAKATLLNCVADRPCSICTTLQEHIPSDPLSCQLPAG